MTCKIDIDKLHQIAVDETDEEKALAKDIRANGDLYKASARIALKIKRKMRVDGLSKEDVAKILKVSVKKLDAYLSGKYNFSLKSLVNIENRLGIDILSLYCAKANAIKYDKYNFSEVEEFVGSQLHCWLRGEDVDIILPTEQGNIAIKYGTHIARTADGSLYVTISDKDVIDSVKVKVSKMKDLEPEFGNVIEENFFDLL